MTWDGKAFGQEIVGAVKAHISDVVGPILKRIEQLEAVSPKRGEKGDPGTDGRDGSDGAPGKDGIDGKDAVLTPEMVVDAVKALPEAIAEAVSAYLTENPPASGKDGRDGIDGKDGADGTAGKDGIDGMDGAPGKDGCGIKELLIDREGQLVATMDDGRMKALGIVTGKDGAPGMDGKDGAPGAAGKDGIDGVGFDDLDVEIREDGVFWTFTKGEVVKEARIPVVIDCGVWKEGRAYYKGNGVSWGGQFWICQEDTEDKPDTSKAWRLSVKKGRDGKDAPKPDKGK